MWTQSTSVTDGRTDRQTDRITITDAVQRIASHGKNWRFDLSLEHLDACLVKFHFQLKTELAKFSEVDRNYNLSLLNK